MSQNVVFTEVLDELHIKVVSFNENPFQVLVACSEVRTDFIDQPLEGTISGATQWTLRACPLTVLSPRRHAVTKSLFRVLPYGIPFIWRLQLWSILSAFERLKWLKRLGFSTPQDFVGYRIRPCQPLKTWLLQSRGGGVTVDMIWNLSRSSATPAV